MDFEKQGFQWEHEEGDLTVSRPAGSKLENESQEQHRVRSFETLLRRFASERVLIWGDMVADEYVIGRPNRISREAPVLILHYADGFVRPGGATNTALNICTLGAKARVVGSVGDDEPGRKLIERLDEVGIDTRGLIVDSGRPTSTKTRILAKGTQEVQQQIVRIDRVDGSAIEGAVRDRLIEAVRHALPEVDALLISDYEHGVISQEVLDACLPDARKRAVTITVDSHGDLFRFKGVTAATPNQPEAESTLRRSIGSAADLVAAGEELIEGMQARGVLITRGSEGVALFERGQPPYTLPVSTSGLSDIVDPTGAGDTVAAVFTVAVTAGASMPWAAYLANVAGGEVVRRLGAATVTPADLTAALKRTRLPAPR